MSESTIRQLFVVVTLDTIPTEDFTFGQRLETTSFSVAEVHTPRNIDSSEADGMNKQSSFQTAHYSPDPASERYELRMRNSQDTAKDIKNALIADLQRNINKQKDDSSEDTRKAPLKSYNEGLVLLNRYPDSIATKVLSYLGDIIEDDDTLENFGVVPNVYGYVELHMRLVTAKNESPSEKETSKSDTKSQREGASGWVPLPREAHRWVQAPGQPHPKVYVLHAMRTGGPRAVIRLMKQYSDHARNQEECIFALIKLASVSGNGSLFRNRLALNLRAMSLAALAARSFPDHIGVQKQMLALACYCCGGLDRSMISHPATGKKCVVSTPPQLALVVLSTPIAKYGGGGPIVLKTLGWAIRELEPLEPLERLAIRGSCLGDIVESAFLLLSMLLQFVESSDGGAEEWGEIESDEDIKARIESCQCVRKLVLEGESKGSGPEGLESLIQRGLDAVIGCSFETSAKSAGEKLLASLRLSLSTGGLANLKDKKKSKKKQKR